MDGKGLVDFIRQQSWQASVPILMVTSEANMGRLAAIEAAGVSGICDKPFEAHVVRDLLGRLCWPIVMRMAATRSEPSPTCRKARGSGNCGNGGLLITYRPAIEFPDLQQSSAKVHSPFDKLSLKNASRF
jgi:CheY-like chemotaxis protein